MTVHFSLAPKVIEAYKRKLRENAHALLAQRLNHFIDLQTHEYFDYGNLKSFRTAKDIPYDLALTIIQNAIENVKAEFSKTAYSGNSIHRNHIDFFLGQDIPLGRAQSMLPIIQEAITELQKRYLKDVLKSYARVLRRKLWRGKEQKTESGLAFIKKYTAMASGIELPPAEPKLSPTELSQALLHASRPLWSTDKTIFRPDDVRDRCRDLEAYLYNTPNPDSAVCHDIITAFKNFPDNQDIYELTSYMVKTRPTGITSDSACLLFSNIHTHAENTDNCHLLLKMGKHLIEKRPDLAKAMSKGLISSAFFYMPYDPDIRAAVDDFIDHRIEDISAKSLLQLFEDGFVFDPPCEDTTTEEAALLEKMPVYCEVIGKIIEKAAANPDHEIIRGKDALEIGATITSAAIVHYKSEAGNALFDMTLAHAPHILSANKIANKLFNETLEKRSVIARLREKIVPHPVDPSKMMREKSSIEVLCVLGERLLEKRPDAAAVLYNAIQPIHQIIADHSDELIKMHDAQNAIKAVNSLFRKARDLLPPPAAQPEARSFWLGETLLSLKTAIIHVRRMASARPS